MNPLQRIEVLKDILLKLHHGADPASVQEQFNQHFKGVSALEISLMEHQLMSGDTGIQFEDVMKLCNVHANLFKGSIDALELSQVDRPGHPVRVFKDENLALQSCLIRIQRILDTITANRENIEPGLLKGLLHQLQLLGQFDIHYERKEKLFFPHMERKGHVAPPKVMWGVDDDIRDLYQTVYGLAKAFPTTDISNLTTAFATFALEFKEMIFKEESILLNILLEIFTEDDWYQIAREQSTYGFCLIATPDIWVPERKNYDALEMEPVAPKSQSDSLTIVESATPTTESTYFVDVPGGRIKMAFIPDTDGEAKTIARNRPISFGPSGYLSLEEINLILTHLPMEITFVSADNVFQYFNNTDNYDAMLFPRTPSQIGRDMELCHPPKIWDKVHALIEDFRHDRRDEETLWFQKGKQFIHIRYQALRNAEGQFCGILETVQDIQPYRDLPQTTKRTISPLPPKIDQ